MRHLGYSLCGVLTLCAVLAAASAHQITYKGLVVSAAANAVEVRVVDPETERSSLMTFDLDAETRILRGDVLVTFEEAQITADENISVTIDHDLDATLAVVIRLDARG